MLLLLSSRRRRCMLQCSPDNSSIPPRPEAWAGHKRGNTPILFSELNCSLSRPANARTRTFCAISVSGREYFQCLSFLSSLHIKMINKLKITHRAEPRQSGFSGPIILLELCCARCSLSYLLYGLVTEYPVVN